MVLPLCGSHYCRVHLTSSCSSLSSHGKKLVLCNLLLVPCVPFLDLAFGEGFAPSPMGTATALEDDVGIHFAVLYTLKVIFRCT